MSERWTESVDLEEYLVCDCGRVKPPGMLWGIVPRKVMVELIGGKHPVYFATCVYCKREARKAFDDKGRAEEFAAFDPGI